MARALAEHGHPLRTFEQVWSKVKELWLSCVRAGECLGAGPHSCPYYSQLHCILVDEEETSSMIVDTGLGSPVIVHPEQEHKREGQPAAPAEDEETSPTITLSLEPLPGSQEVSQASSEAGEGSSAGSEGPASPPMPPARVWGTQRCARPWDQLMWQQLRTCSGRWLRQSTPTMSGASMPRNSSQSTVIALEISWPACCFPCVPSCPPQRPHVPLSCLPMLAMSLCSPRPPIH